MLKTWPVTAVESTYLDVVDSFPEWHLEQRREHLRTASAPDAPDLALPPAVADRRKFQLLEPLPDAIGEQQSVLSRALGGDLCAWPLRGGVPVLHRADGRRCIIFLHLFVGRRRDRDCHIWLQTLSPEYLPGYTCVMVSADTAIDGNLAAGEALQSLLRLARAGVFAMVLTGPPCETWTSARRLPPASELAHRWPRPLRSASHPWGTHGLTTGELHQLSQGSSLMLTSLEIELHVIHGGGAAMEHPDIPRDATHVSIWRTDLHRQLFGRRDICQQLRVEQWRFGATAIKPTILRFVGRPPLAKVLYQQYNYSHERPEQSLGGWDFETKSYRTAAAKEYPAEVCRALMLASLHGLRTRLYKDGSQPAHESQLEERDIAWMDRLAQSGLAIARSHHLAGYQPT